MKTTDTPVLLLTGYLGSGKTTLVNHILANERGIKFAVIVNDIGEVNIDASLIQKEGIVGKKDDSLVALQNGCICCTLKMDLVEQITDLIQLNRFDYIVIEASGICEPEPIAQTICSIPQMNKSYTQHGICHLDCIVTVVDALRLQSEFDCGGNLTRQGIEEEDIENLIIQQIEFCNIILLNKASEVQAGERNRIKQILHTLQPQAEIIECDYAKVDLGKIIHTGMFDFEKVATDTIITTKAEKLKNTASAHSFTIAARLSTSTNSTTSSAPNCPAMSSVPREFAISTSTVTSATSSNKPVPKSNSGKPVYGMPLRQRKIWSFSSSKTRTS